MTIVKTRHGLMKVIESDAVVSKSLTLYGEWAYRELLVMQKFIRLGMSVLDVGAFVGSHTLAFSHFVGSAGKVYAFEPRREIYNILKENVELNDVGNVKTFNVGLSDESGKLYLEPIDISSNGNFGGLVLGADTGHGLEKSYSVDILTIDLLGLPAVDFIKLDVEGMELHVLNGAKHTLIKDAPVIFCECNTLSLAGGILEFAKSLEYRVFGVLSPAFNEQNYNLNADNIFSNAQEFGLFLVPLSKLNDSNDLYEYFNDSLEIFDLDDIVLPLLHKPQYPYEVLRNTSLFNTLGFYFPSPKLELIEREKNNLQIELLNMEQVLSTSRDINVKLQMEIDNLVNRENTLKQKLFGSFEINKKLQLDLDKIAYRGNALKQELFVLRDTNKKLQLENDELADRVNSLQSRLSRVLNSYSWRFTGFLRFLASKNKNLFEYWCGFFKKNK
jgi:FkbM family methyltransferase